MKVDIIAALKAKLKDKSSMPDWYFSRMGKCIGCEHNTGNIDKLSLKDRLRTAHNFGKDACVICTCGIEDKCSDEFESCPDTPSQWHAVRIKGDKNIYKLENHSPEKINLIKDKGYTIDYGIIKKGFDTKVKVLFNTKGEELKDFSVEASCGCTKPSFEKQDKGYLLTIAYDSNRVGSFTKTITIIYNKKEEKGYKNIKLPFKITGDVR